MGYIAEIVEFDITGDADGINLTVTTPPVLCHPVLRRQAQLLFLGVGNIFQRRSVSAAFAVFDFHYVYRLLVGGYNIDLTPIGLPIPLHYL